MLRLPLPACAEAKAIAANASTPGRCVKMELKMKDKGDREPRHTIWLLDAVESQSDLRHAAVQPPQTKLLDRVVVCIRICPIPENRTHIPSNNGIEEERRRRGHKRA